MKAIWSFWTKPFQAHRGPAWASEKHHLFAWVLSVETARKHYPKTCLYTDDTGAELLIDGIGLEFEHVSTELNALDGHDPDWWALGKVYTYRLQTGPFVHLDNDVFLWKPLPKRIESALVFAQNPDWGSYYQPERFEYVLKNCVGWLPEEWLWYRSAGRAQGISCGVFGGNQVDFINYYANSAIRLIEHPSNQRGWLMLHDKGRHTVLFEQYLLSACIEYHRGRQGSPYRNINVQYLFNSPDEAFNPHNATQAGFTHLIADAKRNRVIADHLKRRVQRDYPEYYERCIKHIRA